MKNTGGVYSCSCPAWRNQGLGIDGRTCKHLVAHRGDQNEVSRVGFNAMPTAWKKANGGAASAAAPVKAHKKKAPKLTAGGNESTSAAAVAASDAPVLLAQAWTPDVDPTGKQKSEKLDGVRAWWNGKEFISRKGNLFYAPEAFKRGMPEYPLDGELYLGRGQFQKTISIVRTQNRDTYDKWKDLRYMVFDAPEHPGIFLQRYAHYMNLCQSILHAEGHVHAPCSGMSDLEAELIQIEAQGGEGVMLRDPKSKYQAGRNNTLLKVKSFFDAECEIVGTYPGKGKFKGVIGGYECVMHQEMTVHVGGKSATLKKGVTFRVGSGLKDAQRRSPASPGTIITYRFVELTNDGNPRHPSFVGVRDYE